MDQCVAGKRKINPRETANVFSFLTFGYTISLFKKGFQRDLEEEDLYEVINSCRSKQCGDKTEKAWKKCTSIYRLLWKRYRKIFIFIGIITIAWKEIYSIVQPYAMSHLISYFEKGQTKISKSSAYYCASIVIFLNVFKFIFEHNLQVFEFTVLLRVQASLKSLLYRKSLRLSPTSLSDTSLGNIVTVLTKDIQAVEENLWLILDLIVYIIQFSTVCYLLWARLGNSAFIGVGLLFVALPIQIYLGHWLTKMRLKVGKNSDERLQVTQEILSAIKIIKMYTWEKFFYNKINESRITEVTEMMKTFYLHMVIICLGILTSKITFLLLILSYIWMGHTTSTELIFYVLSLFHQLTISFGIHIPRNIAKLAEVRASFIRLNKLLQAAEIPETKDNVSGKPSIYLNKVTAYFKEESILENISVKVTSPCLTLVTGLVGSGKSSLLKVILQDYPIAKGDLEVWGTTSYAAQDPWLFPATIKQNIMFGEKYDVKRYEEVKRVCALNYDLSLFEKGDETIVTDKGQNLSKGQQCRINLARAVYRSTDIYLLDDSLTALDSHVQDFIFNECIKKFLNNKICILVTQNDNHIKQADNVLVMDKGKILISEIPDNIISRKDNIIFSILAEKEKHLLTKIENEKPAFILETEQQYNKQKVYHEVKQMGNVELFVYKRYLQLGGGLLIFSCIIILFVITQTCESFSDKLITQWIDLQQKVLDLQANSTINDVYYKNTMSKKNDTFGVYTGIVILKIILGLVEIYALLRFCRNASINIHRMMSSRVVNAIMSFFDTHFIGNILNRFSLDLNNIDELIPFLFPGLFRVFFSCIGAVVLVSTVNWLFLIPATILAIILFLIRLIYIPTGRSLKRLEAATRSPIVGHINSSLEGLTTIRAFKAEQILKDEFDKHQDLYTSAFFIRICTTNAFVFYMDVTCTLFTIIVIVRFLFFDHDISAGNVGLALTQVFMLTHHIQWGINQWAQLESNMTSVERALEFCDIKQEDATNSVVKNWPTEGGIIYENVSLYYESSINPVLKDISFSVRPKEKIGIVGRTGAGKSSILSTLFRLYNYEGKILIDGLDISGISLKFLRSNIAIIPQDPILFTGTIRDNIDPTKKYTDEKIWKILDKVKVKNLIPSLNFEVKEGSCFSSGQKQLICLARAAIGKYKIVVLDEATANMDPVTDKMLHDIIEDIFSHCTILTIAHRLHSVINYDFVMVLDCGRLVEFDNPKKLIENETSAFYKMWKKNEI